MPRLLWPLVFSFFSLMLLGDLHADEEDAPPEDSEHVYKAGASLSQAFMPRTAEEAIAVKPKKGQIGAREEGAAPAPRKKDTTLPGGYIKMSGRYRLAMGIQDGETILNDSNANLNLFGLQGPSSEYLFGERLFNTHDRAIYSQHLLNLDFAPERHINFHTQIVNDPWSWVGTTGEQVQRVDPGDPSLILRYDLKYFGANNSTLPEIFRSNYGDRFAFPRIKVHDGQTTRSRVSGFDFFSPPNGVEANIPNLDIDYEYRPIRKLWMDANVDPWHVRLFALNDEGQALTTDDPLGLSNHKDYWQQSPWLYQYKPLQSFTDIDGIDSIKRGYYSDSLSFIARDSEGNRLVLLRGAAIEGKVDKTTLAATVAAPYTPWDEHYFDADNVPGAVRLKHQLTDQWMLGGTYAFRLGLVDDGLAEKNQVWAIDTQYAISKELTVKAEAAANHRDLDLYKTRESLEKHTDGYAYKAALESKFVHDGWNGQTELEFSFTQMGKEFKPALSNYLNTRDDEVWGQHVTFLDISPDIEPFRLGDGVFPNRYVGRFRWKEKLFKKKFENLFDVRNVHRTKNDAYIETVARDEITYHVNDRLTAKGLFRWRGLPKTTPNVDPVFAGFYFPKDDVDIYDFNIRNTAVEADKDADQYTYGLGLQYVLNRQWTLEGIAERSNAIPDFPRGLLDEVTKDSYDRIDGITTERFTHFLYNQAELKAKPPYPYFTLTKQRLIWKPETRLTVIFHAAQNSYKYEGGIYDNLNHAGVGALFNYNKKLSLFADYTFSKQNNLPKAVASSFRDVDFEGHHNVYLGADYRINSSTVFRAEYGVFGLNTSAYQAVPGYSVTTLYLPTMDTEHLFRASLTGEF